MKIEGKDIIQVIQYLSAFSGKKEKPQRSRSKRKLDYDDDVDLAEIFIKLNAREQRIKNAKEQIEKMMKKEEKKDDKDKKVFGMTLVQRAVVFTILAPPVGLGYVAFIHMMMQNVLSVVGVK